MRWRNTWTLVKQGEPAASLHVSDNTGYQRWRGDVLLWHSACVPAWTHTKQAHVYTENAEQTEPTHPRGHGPTRACSYVQMYPKSVWNVADTYLTADTDTHQLWTVSFSSGTCLPTHTRLQKETHDDDWSSLSCIPKPATSSFQEKKERKRKALLDTFPDKCTSCRG